MRRPVLVSMLVALLLAATAGSALAGSDLTVQIRDAVLDVDGQTQLTVAVDGLPADARLSAADFNVRENGSAIQDVQATPLLETRTIPVSVALVVDVSGSTRQVLADQQAAATDFARRLTARGVRIALLSFADKATVLSSLSDDGTRIAAGIAQLQASGETALFDAVSLAAETVQAAPGQHRIVVFSDGGDTVSQASLEDAVTAAKDAGAAVTTVALQTPEVDGPALERLALATGGSIVPVQEAAGLSSAFQQIAQEIASQYILSYRSTVVQPDELPITVTVQHGPDRSSTFLSVLNTRKPAEAAPPALPAARLPQPTIGAFGGEQGLYVGLGAVFVAVLLLLLVLLPKAGKVRAAKRLERGLRIYGRGRERALEQRHTRPSQTLTERAVKLVGKLPKPAGLEDRIQEDLDRAAWPMRANEFMVLTAASAILGVLALAGLSRNPLWAVIGLVGGAIPPTILSMRIQRRRQAFMEQLPSTLQLLAGSLQAGYGLLQAVDTVVKEADAPTSEEFARVLTESRLGLPLDEALESMAQRLDSEDFHWVVLAINIQRQIGGNLAELLTTVAATIRSREQVRRQVRVLSAEGRISAWVVGAMPFVVGGALALINPGYLNELLTRPVGRLMLLAGLVLIGIGVLVLRRMVRINV